LIRGKDNFGNVINVTLSNYIRIYVWLFQNTANMETISELEINILEIRKAAMIFRAINHKLRQDIMKLIHKSGKITVTELYRKMNLEQSVASQHLAILRTAGFVQTERDRRFVFYKVNYKTLEFVEEQSKKLNN